MDPGGYAAVTPEEEPSALLLSSTFSRCEADHLANCLACGWCPVE